MNTIKNILITNANNARENAYAPYSGFSVGAAVADENGNIFSGANIENASYGLTICAERVAICSAIAYGVRKLVALAVSAENITYPCGACLQVFSEFADSDALILLTNRDGSEITELTLGELLPKVFKLGGK